MKTANYRLKTRSNLYSNPRIEDHAQATRVQPSFSGRLHRRRTRRHELGAQDNDPEWSEFVSNNASGDSQLLFGRITFQQMESFWPTPMAHELMPIVAKRMNEGPKVVFSRSLSRVTWNNTRLIKTPVAEAVTQLKKEPGPTLVLMGSASIVTQLAQAGLIDEFQMVVNPIVLGSGKSMFEGVKRHLDLALTDTRRFQNGNVLLKYDRAR